MKTISPYGTWVSPISVDSLVTGAVGISEVIPESDAVWWAESRPSEGGRTALIRYAKGAAEEITPDTANVRTLVHEYGGGAWWVDRGVCYYVDYADQRLRSLKPGGAPLLLTPEPAIQKGIRYSDFRVVVDGSWLIAVSERHDPDSSEPENSLVAVATDGSLQTDMIVGGADFFSSPRISPDGKKLAWIQWDHPNMPWDDTKLLVADLHVSDSGVSVDNVRVVAGGPDESIVQPEWSPAGELHYLSDRGDYWHLFREGVEEPVLVVDGDIGYPPWVFGLSRYAFTSKGDICAARFSGGLEHLDGYGSYTAFHSIRASGDVIAFSASSWRADSSVVYAGETVHSPAPSGIDDGFISEGEQITCTTADGSDVYALYYRPANPDYSAPPDEKPPLIVLAHGGPTSAARSQFSQARQFWTSRGFAVVDVNYRGSSGFGRGYRKKLDGQWGVADVEDCVHVARYLVQRGDVDAKRLIIRGGSAGGYTVLCALAFHDTFTAGANHYGVADLEALAKDTHKFESRYLDGLIGPYPADIERYKARSPIHHLDGFSAPMIVLQGSEDAIVPPNQSRMIVEALDKRSVPVAYLEFEGEQHGFRQAKSIKQALTAELAFYGRIFDFQPAGIDADAVEIRNLP